MRIVMYGTPTCSVCKQAKEWMDEEGIGYDYIDLTEMNPDEAKLLISLQEQLTGKKTVPIIYDDGILIGGFSELKPYIQGELF